MQGLADDVVGIVLAVADRGDGNTRIALPARQSVKRDRGRDDGSAVAFEQLVKIARLRQQALEPSKHLSSPFETMAMATPVRIDPIRARASFMADL
ncbi:MAG: hypothetical protein ACKOUT_03435 [Novosphingobium sp.]